MPDWDTNRRRFVKDSVPVNCFPCLKTRSKARIWWRIFRSYTPGQPRKIALSNSWRRPRKMPVGRVRLEAWPPFRGRASFARTKLDSLSYRQIPGKIDRVGLSAHVLLPATAAPFAAAAGIFLAAKRATDRAAGRASVHV